ncbi:GntR family transcriptional regulator [Frondihabitans australicus]|uniref:DNA-binding GntR family transcriptional regulator n=1 Tax=Frondihabitans australicus TaxID=386892 RepID=A0A495IKV2_9MICO|nr:GntR family transcriptional regulator [Frondihabitans australicus]RKR76632.1 DNA-binding GntR family transcriptional regulator [Frondihabitans australicus]
MTITTDVPAAERAYSETKARIIRGDLPGGSTLSEVAVCAELGLSRTPVHEAFLRLASEELLTLESRKGAVVRPMSPSEADDVVEMREAVEAAAARRLLRNPVPADLVERLQALLDRQESCIADTPADVDGFVEADDEFHTLIVEAARNPIAAHFSRLLHDRAQRLRHHLMRIRPEHLATSLADHRELADAVAAGDADAYARTLARHVDVLRGVL